MNATPPEAFLAEISYALGDQKRTLEESARAGLLVSAAEELSGAGFRFHHVCSPDVQAYDLGRQAVTELGGLAESSDLLLYATCLPANAALAGGDHRFAEDGDVKPLMDYAGSRLQAELGLTDAAVIGVGQQACTGLLGSIRLAGALLKSEPDLRQALCLTADRFPPGARYEQASNLVSDGAAACVVTTEPRGFRLVASHHRTNGAMALASDDETVGSFFSHTHRLIVELVAKAGVALADVAWVVPQNTNEKAWQIRYSRKAASDR